MERLDCDRMFIMVYEQKGFAKAARLLGKSYSQASKMISHLENLLGVQLFKRNTRAIYATDIGTAYYHKVRDLIGSYDQIHSSIKTQSDAPAGRLRITAPISFGSLQLAPALSSFIKNYAHIQLDVSFSDQIISIIDEGYDLAVRIGQLHDSGLIAKKLTPIHMVLVATEDYLHQKGFPQHPSELQQHSCIVDTNFKDPWHWHFTQQGHTKTTISINSRVLFSNAQACLCATLSDLGIAKLPSFIAGPVLQQGKLKQVLSNWQLESSALYAVYPPSRHLAYKTRLLIDHLNNYFQTPTSWDQGW